MEQLTKMFGATAAEMMLEEYEKRIRESEQLRILKNYIKSEKVLTKADVEELIEAMEGNANE